MRDRFVTDTMALVLRLERRKMGGRAKPIFEQIERGEIDLVVPVMVLAEIGYLSEKNRIETSLLEFRQYRKNYPSIQIESATEAVIYKTFEIKDIPELHDRIIAATAFLHDLVLITNDPMMQESEFVSTIW